MAAELVDVVAVERGHDGRMVREVGERFQVPASRLKEKSTWFVDAKSYEPKVLDPKARPPGAGPAKGSAVKDEEDPKVPGANNADNVNTLA